MKYNFIFFLFISNFIFSQSFAQFHRHYSDTMPNSYTIDHSSMREEIFAKFPDNFKTYKRARSCYTFADQAAMYVADEVESGKVYSDWNDLESYLNAILKILIPDSLKQRHAIHVYISTNGNVNASMFPSGTIFFNIGLLPLLNDEAAIAAVLAHELAHYYFNHSVERYLNELNKKYQYGFFTNQKAKYKYSINNELEADSMGMIWVLKSGYNVDGVIEAQQCLNRLDKNWVRKKEESFKMEETTHPSSERRINKVNEYKVRLKIEGGKNFMVSETAFNLFKKESKYEVLNSLLESLYYTSCLETAFIYHIFEPDNSTYIYYILEGIRRYCYFDKSRWDKNFITDNYYVNVDIEGHKKKNPMESSLLEKFDLEVLPIDPNDGIKIKTKQYWREEPVFKTYNEAFSFFCKLGMDLNNPECILSNALSFGNDSSKRNKLLTSYLSFKDIKHRHYARALRSDSLYKSLIKKNLTILSEFHVDVIHGMTKTCLGRTVKDKNSIVYKTAQNSLLNDSVNKTILFDDLKSNNMSDFRILKKMEELALSRHMLIFRDIDLSYIDPSFWETFKKYGVNKIVFEKVTYTPAITIENSLESLKKLINVDHKDMWYQANDLAYLTILESKFEIGKNSFRNSIAICEDYKLKKDKSTESQLENLIKTKKGLNFYELKNSIWGLVLTHQ